MAKAIEGQKGTGGEFRRGLMLYGSTAAIAAALMLTEGGIGPAMAQDIGPRINPNVSAQGDFTVPGASPSPSFEYRSGELDIVHMNRDAVLNWTTYDQAATGGANGNSSVNFLPKDTELRFVGTGESFTAINRIFTNPDGAGAYRAVAFQGRVTSYLSGDGANSVGPVGGNIWFYSPGGILASASASFNVGSLLLSASDIDGFVDNGSYRYASFTGVADPFASVVIQPGAHVTLTQPNSTFAIFAPTIDQGGTVSVNGSVQYVSGEKGSFIAYDSGSVSAYASLDARPGNFIRHTGTTTGPASIATDDYSVYDYQTIEFRTGQDVAVLLSGSIGYAPATDASFGENGSIVLSAGGSVASQGNLTFTSTTDIYAPTVDLRARAGETIAAGSDANGAYAVRVQAGEATVAAEAGGRIDIAGSLGFSGQYAESRDFTVAALAAAGNLAGGQIDIGGDLSVNASNNYYSSSQQTGRASVSIGDGGRLGVGGEMSVLADGYLIDEGDGYVSRGGEANVALTGSGASLAVGDALVISAQGLPFGGNCECSPPSGAAQGGTARLTATGGTISAGGLTVTADAEAYAGYEVQDGALTDSTGGTALVDLGDSDASLGNVNVLARGIGSDGVYGNDGGAAFGGTASFSKGSGGSLTASGLRVSASATGGEGGEPYEGGRAGSGGDAVGGTASLALGQTVGNLGFLELSAQADGGDGSSAEAYYDLDGGSGGNARAGTATLILTGEDTILSGISEGGISVAAYGGSGGNGAEDYYELVQSGNGGTGGSAQAGTLTITAAGGAEYLSEVELAVSATGGEGGDGGDAVFGEGNDAAQGLGGDGGDAIGGDVSLIADGGTISGALYLDVTGAGGAGGYDGRDVYENYTGNGEYGAFTGGSISLATLDNGPSRFDLGYTSLIAGGDQSGAISISHAATDPHSLMRFDVLYASVVGDSGNTFPAFSLDAANTVTMNSGLQVYGGSIAFDLTGTGAVTVGGSTSLSTNYGSITITHTNNPGVISIDSAGFFSAGSNGDYFAGPGTVVRGGSDEFYITARGSIIAADSRGSGSMYISAEGDVTLGNVLVNPGYYGAGDLSLYAGRVDFDGPHGYLPVGNALVTGTVDVAGSVFVEAGGTATFAGGSQVSADHSITVRTGDDLVVASGASLVSDLDSDSDDESIYLRAGDINYGPESGDLIDPIITPIASLVLAGEIDTNGHALYLSGDAIDGTGSSIATGNLYVDVTDAPDMAPFSSDDGLLTAGCFQGSACLGDVTATGNVEIGLESNNDLISLKVGTLDFSGDALVVRTREDLEIRAEAFGSLVTANEYVALESLNSFVSLTNVTVEAPELEIRAGSYLAAGSSSLLSSSDILLQVGGDITVGTIDTAGRLDDGTESPVFTAPGNFTVQSLSYGDGNDIRINAAGDIGITFADPGAADIELVAGDLVYLGSTASTTGSIRLDGASVLFDNLMAGGPVDITAHSGGIFGLSELSPVIDTAGGITLEANSAVAVAGLEAGGDIAISGATVTAASLAAGGSLAVTAEGAGSVGSFESGGSTVFSGASFEVGGGTAGTFLAIEATEGDLTFGTLGAAGAGTLQASGALSGGDVDVGGALTLVAGSMGIGDAAADAGINASIGGDASFTALTSSAGAISVSADGNISGSSIDAAADVSLSGNIVAVADVDAGGDLDVAAYGLTATTLSAGADMVLDLEGGAFLGDATAGGDLALTAGNGITAASLTAGGALSVDSASPATIGEADAGTDLTIEASILQATSLVAGGAIEVGAGAGATIGEAVAGSSFSFTGSSLTVDSLDAATTLNVGVALAADIGTFASGGDATLSGRSLVLGAGMIGGNLSAQAREGDLAFTNLLAANAGVLRASGALKGGNVSAGGVLSLSGGSMAIGNAAGAAGLDAATGGNASFSALTSAAGQLTLDAGGAISGGALRATNGIDARGASMALDSVAVSEGDARLQTTAGALSAGTVSAHNVFADANAGLTLGTVTAGQRAQLTGASVSIGNATAGTDLRLASASDITADVLTAGDGLYALAGFDQNRGEEGGFRLDDGNIAFDAATAGGSAFLTAGGAITGGTLAAGGFASVQAVDSITLAGLAADSAELRSSDGAISASGIAVDGLLRASATALTLAAPGALTIEAEATAGGIGITAGGSMTVDATATGDIALASTGGSVTITTVGQSQEATTGIGAQAVGGGGAVTVTAANAISVTDSLTAGGALSMTAGGLVTLDGTARGQTIALRAGDLAIGSGGTLGSADTQRISLSSSSPVNLGAGASGGFALDQAEFGRIHSGGDLLITALGSASNSGGGQITTQATGSGNGGTLMVNNLTINAGQGGQIGSAGTFGLTAADTLSVDNTLSIAGSGSGTKLLLTGNMVDLDYATAVLSVVDGANAPTGQIGIAGRLITSMSAAAAAEIVGKTPEQVNVRLGQADVVRDTGLFRTSNLTLQGVDAILIQNSGGNPADDRRGLTVGALTVTGAGDGHTLVVINGVVSNATGVGAAQKVTFTTPIAAGSTFNGCVLANIAGCLGIVEPEPPVIVSPVSILFGTTDLIKNDEDEDSEVQDGVADGDPDAPPIDTARIDDPAGRPMIDDPVTGAGNEDLWQQPEQ